MKNLAFLGSFDWYKIYLARVVNILSTLISSFAEASMYSMFLSAAKAFPYSSPTCLFGLSILFPTSILTTNPRLF